MSPALAQRVLALPADVRATLAGVPGPGWRAYKDHRGRFGSYIDERSTSTCGHPQSAWWPANPATAVAAVLRCSIWHAHRLIADDGTDGGDHAAALFIIEAHVARGST